MPRRPPAVARVLERVTRTARRHEMFESGQRVLVACSGGPDSVCLLLALHHLRRLFRIRLEVFHFDHRLRRGSRDDAAYVRRLAARVGLPFHLRSATEPPPKGASTEMWARYVRLSAAASVIGEVHAERLALGHTQDDQAETVLMGLILGWGPEGVSGMRPRNGADVRPLLDVTREEVEAFCRAAGVRPRRDPSNRDTRLLRNAIRLRGIPSLERATGREIKATLARTAELLRIDQEALWAEAVRVASTLVEPTDDGCRLATEALLALPRAIRARVVRRAFQIMGASWTQSDIEMVLDLAAGRPGRRGDLTDGSTARREREYVLVSRTSPESRV
jgi:tRNA(Ile)-lysidine synthase